MELQQGGQLEELDPSDVYLLFVLSVDTHGLQDAHLSGRVFVLE